MSCKSAQGMIRIHAELSADVFNVGSLSLLPYHQRALLYHLESSIRPNIPVPRMWNLTVKSRSRRIGVKHDEDAQSNTTTFSEKRCETEIDVACIDKG